MARTKEQRNAAARKWRKENPGKQQVANLRWRAEHPEQYARIERQHQLSRYNLTIEQYDEMLAGQKGACAVCLLPSDKTLCVDHDHECCPEKKRSCGKCIRGLLCESCNNGLGRFKDSTRIISNALTYVNSRRHWLSIKE